MKFSLPFSFALICVLLFDSTAFCQFHARTNLPAKAYFITEDHNDSGTKKLSLPGFSPDKQSTYKPAIPLMSQPPNTTSLLGDSYWMGSVTTQSYNHGKVGRYYFWDVQGNLRGSHLFLDIAGKNKRGLKLVFPRHRAIF